MAAARRGLGMIFGLRNLPAATTGEWRRFDSKFS